VAAGRTAPIFASRPLPAPSTISANLLGKVSPVRDPTAKNAKGVKEGLPIDSRPLVSSSAWFQTTRWMPSGSKITFQLVINPKTSGAEPLRALAPCLGVLGALRVSLFAAKLAPMAPSPPNTQPKVLECICESKHYVNTGSASLAIIVADAFSTSAWREFPCASIVTMAGKSLTRRCHMASGIPNSNR